MPAKILVLYHYFEKDLSYRDNLCHFLAFGIEPYADYLIIISGPHTLEIPAIANVKYVFTEPKCSDFGGYAQVINDGLNIEPYEYVFFINSSVRGPFIAPYQKQSWLDIFLEQLRSDGDDVGIVGSTICTLDSNFRHSIHYQERFGGSPPFSHVQTMAYGLPNAVLKKLISSGFYQEDRDSTKTLAIENYEIHLSQLILQQGKNLRCLLPEFNQIDYRLPHVNINPTSTIGDPNEVLGYFGRSVHPYEVLFVKTNRHLYTEEYLARLTYSMEIASGSFMPMALRKNEAVQNYLARIKALAISSNAVSDFSYLPGDLENQAKLELALERLSQAKESLRDVLHSNSWKLTAPIRSLLRWLRK
jgi:hypothetical protein